MLPTHAALNGNLSWKSLHLFKTCESSRLDLMAGFDMFLGTTPSEGIELEMIAKPARGRRTLDTVGEKGKYVALKSRDEDTKRLQELNGVESHIAAYQQIT